MTKYRVTAYDICGEYDWRDSDDFAGLLVAAAEIAAKYPRLVVKAHSPNRCDVDTDGLFDDERDAVQDAIDGARS